MNRNFKRILSFFLLVVLLAEVFLIFLTTPFSYDTRNIVYTETYTTFESNEDKYKKQQKSFVESRSNDRYQDLLFKLAGTPRTYSKNKITISTRNLVTKKKEEREHTLSPTTTVKNILNLKHTTSEQPQLSVRDEHKIRDRGKMNIYQYDDICFDSDTYALLWNVLFPQFPSTSDFITSLEEKEFSSNKSKYGRRIAGYVTPQHTEHYEFQVTCRMGCELIITKPNTELKEGTSEILLRFGIYKDNIPSERSHESGGIELYSAKSNHVTLMKAGEKYLLDFTNVYSESGRFAIRWRKKPSSDFEVIPSEVLTPFDPSGSLIPPANNITYVRKTEKSILVEENRKNLFHRMDILNEVARLERCNYANQSFMPKVVLEGYGTVYVQKDLIYPYDSMIDHHIRAGAYQLFLNQSKANEISQRYFKHIKGNYTLQHIVHLEENKEEIQGKRYFIELDVADAKNKLYRTSSWIFVKNDGSICEPNGYQWNLKEKIYLLCPVKNQRRWILFLVKSLNDIILETGEENLHLILVDYNSTDTIMVDILKKAIFPFTYLKQEGKFSKVNGLNLAVKSIDDNEALLFVLDLQLQLPLFLFDYIRKHTFRSRTAYVPILLRTTCGEHPQYTNLTKSSIWQEIGYGMISIYKSDWNRVGGMNETKFGTKWGGEDWDFVEQVIKGKIEVIHHRIPGYYHLYHSTKGTWDGTKLY